MTKETEGSRERENKKKSSELKTEDPEEGQYGTESKSKERLKHKKKMLRKVGHKVRRSFQLLKVSHQDWPTMWLLFLKETQPEVDLASLQCKSLLAFI